MDCSDSWILSEIAFNSKNKKKKKYMHKKDASHNDLFHQFIHYYYIFLSWIRDFQSLFVSFFFFLLNKIKFLFICYSCFSFCNIWCYQFKLLCPASLFECDFISQKQCKTAKVKLEQLNNMVNQWYQSIFITISLKCWILNEWMCVSVYVYLLYAMSN